MYRRQRDRTIRRALGLIILSMAIPTVLFIVAGSVVPGAHREGFGLGEPFAIVADHPYPTTAVVTSCALVVAECLSLLLILMRLSFALLWRALLGCFAVGIPLAKLWSAKHGLPPWRGYVTYHLLWLECATVLMLSLLLVAVTHAMFRRFTSTAPANKALNATVGRGRPPAR
jgi:hypothetical protein